MSETERVTIRLPKDMLDALDKLVKAGEYRSTSDVVRAAIQKFLETEFAPEHIEKVTLDLPKANVKSAKKQTAPGS